MGWQPLVPPVSTSSCLLFRSPKRSSATTESTHLKTENKQIITNKLLVLQVREETRGETPLDSPEKRELGVIITGVAKQQAARLSNFERRATPRHDPA